MNRQEAIEEGELEQNSVCAKFAHTADDGKTYSSQFYNLDDEEIEDIFSEIMIKIDELIEKVSDI